jgi:hypothetical protein
MPEEGAGAVEISTDPSRLDVDAIHASPLRKSPMDAPAGT